MAEIRTRDGRVAGVTLASGEEIDAATVITTAHPQISSVRLLDPAVLPDDFVADIRRWQPRSGTVKIDLALDGLPDSPTTAPDPQIHGGTIVLAENLDDIETAFQQAVPGQPSAMPFADICIPSVFDDSLAPPGQRDVDATRWVPHRGRGAARRGAGRLADGRRPDGAGRARVHRLGAARQVIGPPGCRRSTAWSAGTSSTASSASGRCSTPARGRLCGPAHAGRGPVPGRVGHPRGAG